MSKSKKSTEADIVLAFLTKENRPFSVQNIVDALQKQGVKKTAVERSLAGLVEGGKVIKKEYGKAKVFLLAQDTLQLPDEAEVASADERLRSLTETLTALNSEMSSKRERIAHLKSQYTMSDATERLATLREELARKMARRKELGDGSALMSKQDKFELDKKYFATRALWKKYTKIIREIVDQIGEASGKKQTELYEDIGIETDEDANVNLKDLPEIENPNKPKRDGVGVAMRAAGSNVKRQRLS